MSAESAKTRHKLEGEFESGHVVRADIADALPDILARADTSVTFIRQASVPEPKKGKLNVITAQVNPDAPDGADKIRYAVNGKPLRHWTAFRLSRARKNGFFRTGDLAGAKAMRVREERGAPHKPRFTLDAKWAIRLHNRHGNEHRAHRLMGLRLEANRRLKRRHAEAYFTAHPEQVLEKLRIKIPASPDKGLPETHIQIDLGNFGPRTEAGKNMQRDIMQALAEERDEIKVGQRLKDIAFHYLGTPEKARNVLFMPDGRLGALLTVEMEDTAPIIMDAKNPAAELSAFLFALWECTKAGVNPPALRAPRPWIGIRRDQSKALSLLSSAARIGLQRKAGRAGLSDAARDAYYAKLERALRRVDPHALSGSTGAPRPVTPFIGPQVRQGMATRHG